MPGVNGGGAVPRGGAPHGPIGIANGSEALADPADVPARRVGQGRIRHLGDLEEALARHAHDIARCHNAQGVLHLLVYDVSAIPARGKKKEAIEGPLDVPRQTRRLRRASKASVA
jgi:hypothetical protein